MHILRRAYATSNFTSRHLLICVKVFLSEITHRPWRIIADLAVRAIRRRIHDPHRILQHAGRPPGDEVHMHAPAGRIALSQYPGRVLGAVEPVEAGDVVVYFDEEVGQNFRVGRWAGPLGFVVVGGVDDVGRGVGWVEVIAAAE